MEIKLNELINRCRSETERFMRQESHDTQPCWEIWRRAIVDQNGEAWAAVLDQYGLQVRRWLRLRFNSAPWLRQDEEFLLNATFIRFFRFVDADKFKNFPNLASILSYLQMCSSTTVTDEQRDSRARLLQVSLDVDTDAEEDTQHPPIPSGESGLENVVEKEVIESSDRQALWQIVKLIINDEVDRLLLYLDFGLDIPPREIVRLYPQYFSSARDVYNRRKSILGRLRNNTELKKWGL